MKYKVGDKVKVREWEDMEKQYGLDRDGDIGIMPCFAIGMKQYCGRVMTISKIEKNAYRFKEVDGWRWTDKMLESVDNHKIVITVDGCVTHARLYSSRTVVKTATAKCAPDDTFDFAAGAKLAFDRLMGEEKKSQYYNGKVVCTKCEIEGDFTVGKVYEFKDGTLVDDKGIVRYKGNPCKSPAEIVRIYGFIPFVE